MRGNAALFERTAEFEPTTLWILQFTFSWKIAHCPGRAERTGNQDVEDGFLVHQFVNDIGNAVDQLHGKAKGTKIDVLNSQFRLGG